MPMSSKTSVHFTLMIRSQSQPLFTRPLSVVGTPTYVLPTNLPTERSNVFSYHLPPIYPQTFQLSAPTPTPVTRYLCT